MFFVFISITKRTTKASPYIEIEEKQGAISVSKLRQKSLMKIIFKGNHCYNCNARFFVGRFSGGN